MIERFLPWLNWAITTSFVLFQFFMQATAGLMASQWCRDFSLSPMQVGNLSAAFFDTYVLLQIPVGIAYDKFGVRKVMISASLLLSISCFCMAMAKSYYFALFARSLMGAGSAFGFVGMLYVTAYWFNAKQFAVLVGVAETIALSGVAVGEVGMASLIHNHGWRITMGVAGIIATIITLLAIIFIDEKQQTTLDESPEKEKSPSLLESIFYAITNRQVWLAGLYGFALMAIINVFASLWAIPYLRGTYQWLDMPGAASLVSMLFLGVAMGGPFIAAVSNHLRMRKNIMLTGGGIYLFLCLYIFLIPITQLWVFYLLMLLLGISASSYILTYAITKETTDEKYQGTSLATMNMILMASGPVLQPALGYLLERGMSFQSTVLILPIITFIALGMFYLIREPEEEQTH